MNDFAKALLPSQTLLYRTHIHPLFKFLILFLFFVFLVLIGGAAGTYPDIFTWPYIAGGVALAAFVCLRAIVPLWTLKISLTNEGVIVKRGLIAQSSQEMQLDTIEEVNVEQGWFGRLFGYGAIQIRGIGNNSFVLKWIADPLNFRKAIEAALPSAACTLPQAGNVAKLRA